MIVIINNKNEQKLADIKSLLIKHFFNITKIIFYDCYNIKFQFQIIFYLCIIVFFQLFNTLMGNVLSIQGRRFPNTEMKHVNTRRDQINMRY